MRGEWRPTGPYGGAAEVVRFVPNSPDTALAATRNGLIYVTHDGAHTWELIPFPLQLGGTLHAMEANSQAWYVGMEAMNSWASGVYKSTDAGRTWKQLPGLKSKAIWSLAIAPENADTIAAGGADGVYLSKDAGDSWTRISPIENHELRPVVSLAFHPHDTNVLYAGTTHLPWRTTDGGAHWQSIHSGMLDDSDVFSIVVDPKNPEIVLSSACSGAYRSTVAGTMWSRMPTPHGAFRTYFVALDPEPRHAIFAGTTLGLFRSLDEGKTWLKVTADKVKSLAFDASHPGRVLMASIDGGVLISSNGGETVHEVNDGFSNRSLATLSSAGNILYATSVYEPGEGGLFRSQDFGASWTRIAEHGAGNILFLAAKPTNPNVVYAADHDELFASKDGGRTWLKEISPPGKSTAGLLVNEDGSVLAGTNTGLYRKTAAAAWAPVKFGAAGAHHVQMMDSAGHGRMTMVADGHAFLTDNGGKVWTACGDAPSGTEWYGLSVSLLGNVLAATSHGLLRSTDHCASWTLVKEGLEAGTVSSVLFHPTRPQEAYTTQYGKVLRSSDGGEHWQPLDDRGRDGLYPAALMISPARPDRLLAMFPRRGIEMTTIAVDGAENPQKEKN
jgi:photosystem II stability/assembly factor-like uncharacterized protein